MPPVLACAVLAIVSAPSGGAAAPAARACYVSIVEIIDPPVADYPEGSVAVRIYNGASRLFETPVKPLSKPVFSNRIKFYTAKSMPVRLVVVVWPADAPAAPQRRAEPARAGWARGQDSGAEEDVLGIGFEGLVGDYETDDRAATSKKQAPKEQKKSAVKPEKNGRRGTVILCDTSIAWPPADGKHEIKCGGATLVVNTEMLVGGNR